MVAAAAAALDAIYTPIASRRRLVAKATMISL